MDLEYRSVPPVVVRNAGGHTWLMAYTNFCSITSRDEYAGSSISYTEWLVMYRKIEELEGTCVPILKKHVCARGNAMSISGYFFAGGLIRILYAAREG